MDYKQLMNELENNEDLKSSFIVSFKKWTYPVGAIAVGATIGALIGGFGGSVVGAVPFGIAGCIGRCYVKDDYQIMMKTLKDLKTKEQGRLVGMVQGTMDCTTLRELKLRLESRGSRKKLRETLKCFIDSLNKETV